MKNIILAFFVCSSIAVKAQSKIPFYLRVEMNQSNVKNSDGRIQKGPGAINLGGGIETIIPLIKGKTANLLAFDPSVTYLPTGYKTLNSTYKVKVNYIAIALPLIYASNLGIIQKLMGYHSVNTDDQYKFFFGAGPYFNYAVSGKFMLTSIDDYKKMSFGNGINDNRTATDAGAAIKLGMKIPRCLVGIQKNIGISNVIPNDRISNGSYIKTRSFLFSVSYNIGKK